MWAVDIPKKGDDKLAPLFTEYMQNSPEAWSIVVALEYLHNIIEDEGPFHGVIGVSEGASVAATLLAEDIQSCKAKQTRSDFRCGLFYIGAPAWSADGMRVLSGDEDGHIINLPTCHIIGATDVFKVGAEQLLKICNRDTALVINDPVGHRIPQDMPTNQQIADWIRVQERVFVKGEA